MGLLDLIARAHEQCNPPWEIVWGLLGIRQEGIDSTGNTRGPLAGLSNDDAWDVQDAIQLADEALAAAKEGEFEAAGRCAARSARCESRVMRVQAWRVFCDTHSPSIDPTWAPLHRACDLAARIDALLATLEPSARPLALACRDDLDGLPVLADWCDDNGQPAAAAELRHLGGLVRCVG
jgi:hypothetical protein